MQHTNTNELLPIFVIMIISGLLSTMNVFADKWDDVRFWSLNDFYMTFLMTGWMFLLMGLYYSSNIQKIIGLILVIISLYCIRTQLFMDVGQYIKGMIPHHSMAVFTSKKLLERNDKLSDTQRQFATKIIEGQNSEIDWMKTQEK